MLPWRARVAGSGEDGAVVQHNFYIAAIPPPALCRRMFETWRSFGVKGEFRRLKLHMSILGLAGLQGGNRHVVEVVQQLVGQLRLPSFELLFDRFATFGHGPDPRPLVFASSKPAHEPDMLAAQLHRALASRWHGPVRRKRVNPHVTASYGSAFPGMLVLPEPIRWAVSELVLIDNWVGFPRYDHLARWPLTDTGAEETRRSSRQLVLPGLFDD